MDQWRERFAETVFSRASDTAHDLKTPLNIAVLSLELLKMRVRKVVGEEDEKIRDYSSAVETELRRLASIFDAFFINSVPPHDGGEPELFDAGPLFAQAAEKNGLSLQMAVPALVLGHRARITALAAMLCEGASRLLRRESVTTELTGKDGFHLLTMTGQPADSEVELGKLFKFYYTDAAGAPDLSLATSRLIAETYGGELRAAWENEHLRLELLLPQGGP